MASFKSLFIRAVPNPPAYSLLEGAPGITPGTGLLTSLGQHLPVLVLIMSANAEASNPHCTPIFMASAPEVWGPRWITRLPISIKTSVARSTSSGGAPIIKVSFPAWAPTMPPDMGASMNLPWPEEWAALATSAEDIGSMVEQSMKRRSWCTPSRSKCCDDCFLGAYFEPFDSLFKVACLELEVEKHRCTGAFTA
ncbi:hypothetical protein KCU77_g70, partial [Aureobasidium melanogenum]